MPYEFHILDLRINYRIFPILSISDNGIGFINNEYLVYITKYFD